MSKCTQGLCNKHFFRKTGESPPFLFELLIVTNVTSDAKEKAFVRFFRCLLCFFLSLSFFSLLYFSARLGIQV